MTESTVDSVSSLLAAEYPSPTPATASDARVREVAAENERLRAVLLGYTLPVTMLTCGRITVSSPAIVAVLSRLRANLGVLRAVNTEGIALPSSASDLEKFIAARCVPSDVESASQLVEQRCMQQADHIVNLYNVHSATATAVSSPAEVLAALQADRRRVHTTRERTAHLEGLTVTSDMCVVRLLSATLRNCLQAADSDTVEKAAADAHDKLEPQLLAANNAVIAAKVRLIKAQVVSATYQPQHIEQLSRISAHVAAQTEAVSSSLRERAALLERYRELGQPLKDVVKEFARLRKRCDQLRWSKQELGLQ